MAAARYSSASMSAGIAWTRTVGRQATSAETAAVSTVMVADGEAMAAGASALVKKLNRFLPLKPDELASLAEIEARRRAIAAHTEIVHERQEGHHAFILQEGWASAYKLLPDRGRQVIDFSVPGDFMGLRSVLLRTSDHAFAAVSDIIVAEVSARQMIDTFQRLPRLGAAILWAASRDEAMVVEHLVRIGRRNALVRTAHLLLELGLRLQLVGLGSDSGFACPLNHISVEEALPPGFGVVAVQNLHHRLPALASLRQGHLILAWRARPSRAGPQVE
jgi:CRP-like cAMP-binding protein